MTTIRTSLAALALAASAAPSAWAQGAPCGGDFEAWKARVAEEARSAGVGEAGLAALAGAGIDPKVIERDRAKAVFTLPFAAFADRIISQNRLDNGAKGLRDQAAAFARAESEFGVQGPVIAAFWGLETDFGGYQGDFVTVNALATLAHDCRRPDLFRPQLLALLELIERGIVPASVTGAWAGEIGQVQILPADYLRLGIDGDGDGRVDMKASAADAILTAANFLHTLGWKAGSPWMEEVTVPAEMDWSQANRTIKKPVSEWQALGVSFRNGSTAAPDAPASLILPMGRKGPAFLSYENFDIFLEWNQSMTYVTTASYFATRLAGAPHFTLGNPEPGLDTDQMKALQAKLQAQGYDVGEIDGILGEGTRNAVRDTQIKLGLPADAWPTPDLLSRL